MPITTLDPFGGVILSDCDVTIVPDPRDADVRVWVDGLEVPLQKTVAIHLEGATEETTITFTANGETLPAQYGYMEYTDYYYVKADYGTGVSCVIHHPGRPDWIEVFALTKNITKTIDLTKSTVNLSMVSIPSGATITVVDENNVTVASGTSSINADLNAPNLYTYTVSLTGYNTICKSIFLNEDMSLQIRLTALSDVGTLTILPTGVPEAETQFYAEETSDLYAWSSTLDNLTYYTKTSVPNVGDQLYDENGVSVGKVITAYDPATGIEYADL